ncbi:hypothetical protein E2C01_083064 [Portunus trituberculatus]|uniref:Uncharacterized protein n=1 Tax=Portunus trituberculatus TaxID=210409 RepID=A0A5B7ITX6_PORTR|nr:hypothetical protein [Portunus trituberculatus]
MSSYHVLLWYSVKAIPEIKQTILNPHPSFPLPSPLHPAHSSLSFQASHRYPIPSSPLYPSFSLPSSQPPRPVPSSPSPLHPAFLTRVPAQPLHLRCSIITSAPHKQEPGATNDHPGK